jgi:hypothetical protein
VKLAGVNDRIKNSCSFSRLIGVSAIEVFSTERGSSELSFRAIVVQRNLGMFHEQSQPFPVVKHTLGSFFHFRVLILLMH